MKLSSNSNQLNVIIKLKKIHKQHLNWAGICGTCCMANENPIHFTLSDDTNVIIKKVANNKYDFELTLANGNRKTFIWSADNANELTNHKGSKDRLVAEAISKFGEIMNA